MNPYRHINLVGDGIMRGVTLALPTEQVRHLLPWGLALGEQDLTPPGTHPVILFFYELFGAHMSVPTLLPSMTYREHIVGVPYTYVAQGVPGGGAPGPFFFMPKLLLDNTLATLGGRLWWGFAKDLAAISLTEQRYAVSRLGDGAPLVSLDFEPTGDLQSVYAFPHFEPIWRMMNQPLISQVPLGMGPLFVCSNFDKQWDTAQLRPLSTAVTLHQEFVPGLPCGRFPTEGRAAGIDQLVLGSYELRAHWRQGLIYPYGGQVRQAAR